MMAPDQYRPLDPAADRGALLAHALHWGIGGLDGDQLRRLDSIAQAQATSYPQQLEPHQARVLETLSELRHRIAAEQTRRAQTWARIAAQLAGLDGDPDQDAEIMDQDAPPEMTDQERACRLLAAALTLIMGPQGGNGNGGGRPVRPLRPGPTTPPQDGRALSLPGTPPTSRRGDDDGIAF